MFKLYVEIKSGEGKSTGLKIITPNLQCIGVSSRLSYLLQAILMYFSP